MYLKTIEKDSLLQIKLSFEVLLLVERNKFKNE